MKPPTSHRWKNVQDMSTAELLHCMVRSKWYILSHPWPHQYRTICSSICYNERSGCLAPHVILFILHVVYIYMHYLAHPLHRIKMVLQGDPQLHCLRVKSFKGDVGWLLQRSPSQWILQYNAIYVLSGNYKPYHMNLGFFSMICNLKCS